MYADVGQFATDEFGHAYQKRSGPSSNTGWLRLRAVQMYDILTDLPDEDCHLDGDVAIVLGGTAAFDEGGGMWVYQSDCELADDGYAVIKPDDVEADEPGRWRLFNNQSLSRS